MIRFSKFLDKMSEFFANRKGLLPISGIILIGINLILRIVDVSWIESSDIFLHFGVILAILGFLLAWAL